MQNEIRAEFIKERRSANRKMFWIVPMIFVLFNVLVISLMGESPEGKSYLVATAFNWYPLMILPIVLSLLVVNINNKEKEPHIIQQRSLGLNRIKMILAKNMMVIIDLFIILFISTALIYGVGVFILQEYIVLKEMAMAMLCLFIGSLPLIGISFILYNLSKGFLVVFLNFICSSFPAAIIAVTKWWVLYPWSYSLRILAPVVGIHPNGTFLNGDSPLWNPSGVIMGIALSVGVYVLSALIQIGMERRRSNG